RTSYLLFHSVIELVSISVAFSMFLLIRSVRKTNINGSYTYLGTAYLFVGVITLLHMLSYRGMGVFQLSNSANSATQLWIAARAVEAVTMLFFPFVVKNPERYSKWKGLLIFFLLVTVLSIASIFIWNNFPDAYIDGEGLTLFKIISEYIFCLILLAAIFLLKRQRHLMDRMVWRQLTLSLWFSIAAELFFTLYSDVYGLTNTAGHYLKFISYILIFNALIHSTLQSPYTTIFRNLKDNHDKLSLSESLHSAMVENIPDILGILDAEGTIIYKSGNLKKYFGWNTAEMLGQKAWHAVHPDDLPMMKETFLNLLNEPETSRSIILKYRHKDGHYSPIELTARNLLENPDINGILINYHDISSKMEAEQKLYQSEERFRALHNASFGGIAIHDKGIILECNQGLSDITGYKYEEMIGMDGLQLIASSRRNEVMSRILSGYERPYESLGCRKDGSEYPIRLEARNIPYRGRTVRVTEFRDITDQKESEKEKAALQEELLQVQKLESVGRLAGGIAHDFNNMLGVILGYTDMLLDQNPEGGSARYLNEIKRASERSAELTRQLLAFARKQVVHPVDLNLNENIETMMDMLKKMMGSEIDLYWKPGTLQGKVHIDPNQLNLILVNLCLNARESIQESGTVTIETGERLLTSEDCRTRQECSPGEYITLAVSDSGRELNSEEQAHVFEPFFSSELETGDRAMDLPSVYGCVKQNNGFIELESEKGRGTVFTIHLPLVS
ncbi:MAG: MASE3 domain-containing protein, partial [Spirochaetales bacterium]|nr:MASE3 domain-containing protein [Spirochaetales bacterium]